MFDLESDFSEIPPSRKIDHNSLEISSVDKKS